MVIIFLTNLQEIKDLPINGYLQKGCLVRTCCNILSELESCGAAVGLISKLWLNLIKEIHLATTTSGLKADYFSAIWLVLRLSSSINLL